MQQVTAVIATTIAVLAENGITFKEGMRAKDFLTKDMETEIHDRLVEGFNNKEISLSSPQKSISSYVTGLMNNCYTKSSKLNGSVKYEPKNPGSRPSDSRLKALKALQVQFAGDAQRLALIDAQIAEINKENEAKRKSATKPVDLSVLGDEFLSKLA